jgi:uncharacterized protein YjbI with pentapeptide repeats
MRSAGNIDPFDTIKKDLEIKKLEREIAQLDFVAAKQALITAADQAAVEKSERDRDIERFTREQRRLEEEIEKLTLEREQLRREIKSRWTGLLKFAAIIGPMGSVLTAIIALFLTYSSLNVTKHLSEEQGKLSEEQARLSQDQAKLSEEQIAKLKADQILDQDKFFRETLEKAAESNPTTPSFSEIAFIRALDGFWNGRHASALAGTLVSILVYNEKPEIQQACAEELARAVNANSNQSDRSAIIHLLFGSPGATKDEGNLGVVQETLGKLGSQAQHPDLIKTALLKMISKAAGHLETTNFHDFSVDSLLMAGARFAGSNLEGLQAIRWTLDKADLSGCDLQSARFADCSLGGASFKGAHLGAAVFTGSNLTGADFTGADGIDKCYLGGADISTVIGLDNANRNQAYDQGAVEMSSLDFDRWKSAGLNVPKDRDERKSWVKVGFRLDPDGNPIMADGQRPNSGLKAVAQY